MLIWEAGDSDVDQPGVLGRRANGRDCGSELVVNGSHGRDKL